MEPEPGHEPEVEPAENPKLGNDEGEADERKRRARRQADLHAVSLVGAEGLEIEMMD